jgi:5-methylcytosine-specific restriction endonuclease McrA
MRFVSFSAAAQHHLALHLPWWLWALGFALFALTVVEEQQRARRKARHRAYLRSPAWNNRRRDALVRAGGRCMDCGSTRDLHVHHLTYKRHGREEARDLRVLCSRCHRKRHLDGGRIDDATDRLVGWIREKSR